MAETSTLITFSKISNGNRRGAVKVLGVVLPFPRAVQIETTYDWQAEELGVLGSALMNNEANLDSAKAVWESSKAVGEKIMAASGKLAAGVTGDLGGGIAAGGFAAAGIAINPKEEVLFKGVKHRTFALTFDLAPLTKSDSLATMQFLSKIHEFAAPSLTGGGAFYKYPGTLDVTIMGTDGVVINRGNCAITGLDCNMTPDSVWASFENGKPVHIILTVAFIELTLPTAEKEVSIFG